MHTPAVHAGIPCMRTLEAVPTILLLSSASIWDACLNKRPYTGVTWKTCRGVVTLVVDDATSNVYNDKREISKNGEKMKGCVLE